MATPTPWQVAGPRQPTRRQTVDVFARDTYNFGWPTTTSGTNVELVIPATGPNAAGAPPPTSARTIIETTIIMTGTEVGVVYGNNLGDPKV